ncbi:MAG TPA: DUF998 domain-containing protein [Candidatus Dormibacteraeota bacterium]|nr:DUF998 domain-containing protein [Candidatus Dormibacteraeota bacterium]
MKKLLYAGVIGPPLFIAVFLVEGFTRPGYSPWRHYVSQLGTGPGAYVQDVNFVLCGSLVLLFAIALRAAIKGSRGSIGAPIIAALFGIALVVAGVFPTDPALGYPVGAVQIHTVHGMIHGLAGLVAFTSLPAFAFVMAWHFAGDQNARRWTFYSAAIGALVIVMFIAMTTTSTLDQLGRLPNAPTGLLQRIAIIGGWTWIAMLAWHQLRALRALPARPRREIAVPAPTAAA